MQKSRVNDTPSMQKPVAIFRKARGREYELCLTVQACPYNTTEVPQAYVKLNQI